MATMTLQVLSGSTNGRGIEITQTSIGSGDTIHTNSSGTDEVTLWCSNPNAVPHVLTLGWGGTSDPDDLIKVDIPANGWVQVTDRLPIKGTLAIVAAADTAGELSLFGSVIHIA